MVRVLAKAFRPKDTTSALTFGHYQGIRIIQPYKIVEMQLERTGWVWFLLGALGAIAQLPVGRVAEAYARVVGGYDLAR